MKQKNTTFTRQLGFTIIELLAVLSIMAMIATVLVLDFSSQRSARNMVLAENETVTNIRKVQNYMLSARDISTGVPAKFYIVTLVSGASTYTVDAIDSKFQYYNAVETIKLPSTVVFSKLNIAGASDAAKTSDISCLQIIFSAPVGAIHIRGGSRCGSTDLIAIVSDPIKLANLGQNKATIGLNIAGNSKISKALYINPATGQISTADTSTTTEEPQVVPPPEDRFGGDSAIDSGGKEGSVYIRPPVENRNIR